MSSFKPFAWAPSADLDKHEIVIKVDDVGQNIMDAIAWLDKAMDHEHWMVYPRVDIFSQPQTKRDGFFHFKESADLDIVMLFKLTFGGR